MAELLPQALNFLIHSRKSLVTLLFAGGSLEFEVEGLGVETLVKCEIMRAFIILMAETALTTRLTTIVLSIHCGKAEEGL